MRLDTFSYVLPDERIAQSPLEPRDSARLLHISPDSGLISHLVFRDIEQLLRPDDLLVINETRVSAVRLIGCGLGGGYREALLLSPHLPSGLGCYEALVRPGKAARIGDSLVFSDSGLTCCVEAILGDGIRVLRFDGDPVDVANRLDEHGRVPLPPYIHGVLTDKERYQTVYSRMPGSAAAPTAGLHFTRPLLQRIQEGGTDIAKIVLTVGLGTFRPIKCVDDVTKHPMHAEYVDIPQETVTKVNHCRGRVIAVGTTSLRALETAARIAPSTERITKFSGPTNIFIYPGQTIKSVDGLITNFHQPGSTLLLLVATILGVEGMQKAYQTALQDEYRFLSFGDAMLILS